jgi:hypothetical protein
MSEISEHYGPVAGGFGLKIVSGPDVDRRTEFLHFCGRAV